MNTLGATGMHMTSLALELKNEREKRDIPLKQIAEETHISLRHLQSLEEGRYSDMPGGMYNRAFIKAYCEFLDLDHQEILRKYEAGLSPQSEKPARPQPQIPQQKQHFWSNPVFAWSLMLVFSATGLFISRTWIASVFSPYFSHTPPVFVKHEIAEVPNTMSTRLEQTSQVPAPAALAVSEEAPVPSASNPGTPGPTMETVSASDSSSPLRLEVEVTEKCWVSVDSDKGKVIQKILEPGEAQSFDAAEHFFIVIGNAGGVHLRINGLPAKPLGKPGEVVKMLINSKSLPDLVKQTTG
jgi:cytoskeleton protein RodZ